ncbi:DUF1615 family protein [uncultured Thiothrix sp.]|jgi:hypothetical protein|uniref:DUF1615 family protein n=1 Tax=uncultured Thiothrix sp. TaxID=223185 RepID=UPI002603CB09|nr:DUF1615 family protein [uncultured Thiothrix sp.]HMT91680.1 DUF1615 family protein [Thiolinea sp.]
MIDWFLEKLQTLLLWLGGLGIIGLGLWFYPVIKAQLSETKTAAETKLAVPAMSLEQTTQLIKTAEPNAREPRAWAIDLLAVLKEHGLEQSRENICAVIAIADQESGFVANPTIPNLGKISEQAVIMKLKKFSLLGDGAVLFLNKFPTTNDSFMQRIRKAKTERDLDLAYRDLIGGLKQYAQQYKLNWLVDNRFANSFIESNNEINTIGSMQVAVSFAVQFEREKRNGKALSLEEIYQIRDKLYTRKGGLYYGTLLLLGYDSGYDKKIYRFADFNAGRYSSRNAAFQTMISKLAGKQIATDGDLLIYQADGDVEMTVSGTEQVTRNVVQKYNLGFKDYQVRRDLLKEKQLAFNNTPIYQAILKTYQQVTGKKPLYAQLPGIELHSEKSSRILTTAKFATTVNTRYQHCVSSN